MRPVGQVLLKGKSKSKAVYDPLDAASLDADYEAAHGLLTAGDERALSAFSRLHAARPDDPLIAFHLRRLEAGEHGDLLVMADK
jgi:adenylate cyclase